MDMNATEGLKESTLDSLADAYTCTIDALAGYDTMVKEAQPQFRETVIRFRDMHRGHAHDLASILAANGRAPDSDGSFMATVNRLVVKTRSIFDAIDTNVMDAIRDGEAHVIEVFRAVEREPAPEPILSHARAMREELEALLRDAPLKGA